MDEIIDVNESLDSSLAKEVGFKGDVYSGSMGPDDILSDIAAVNLYNRMMNSENGNFWQVMTEYNIGESNGSINSVDEFLKYYGDGDIEKGLEYIKNTLDDPSIGTSQVVKKVSPLKVAEKYQEFLNYLEEHRTK
jgi:hypothetical protein